MTLSRKVEIGGGLAIGLLAIFLYVDLLLQDIALHDRLNKPFEFSSGYRQLFYILTLPGLIVAIGACIHVIGRQNWGRWLLVAGGVLNNFLIIKYAVGLAYAFNKDIWGVLAVLVQFALVIVTLIAACLDRTSSHNSSDPTPR